MNIQYVYHVLQQGHTSNVSGCARCAHRFAWFTTRSSCFINFPYQTIQRIFMLSSVRKLFNHLKRIKSLTSSQNSDENLIIVRQRRHISSLMTTNMVASALPNISQKLKLVPVRVFQS